MAVRSLAAIGKLDRSVAETTTTTTNKLQQMSTFDSILRKQASYPLHATANQEQQILPATALFLSQQQQRIQISKGETIPMVDMTNMQLNHPNGSQVQQQAGSQLQQASHHHLHHQGLQQFSNSMGHIVESTTNLPIMNTTTSVTSSSQVEKMQKEEEQQQQQQRRTTICDQSTHLYQQSPQHQHQHYQQQHHQQHLFSVLINNKTIKGK